MDFDHLYKFMCKEYNKNYETHWLIRSLNEAQGVIFFGHSLSSIYYQYFMSFFKKRSEDNLSKELSKEITIFIYDIESQSDICYQLRNMHDRKLGSLFGKNIPIILKTSNCQNTEQYNSFLAHLKETSKGSDSKKLKQLAYSI